MGANVVKQQLAKFLRITIKTDLLFGNQTAPRSDTLSMHATPKFSHAAELAYSTCA